MILVNTSNSVSIPHRGEKILTLPRPGSPRPSSKQPRHKTNPMRVPHAPPLLTGRTRDGPNYGLPWNSQWQQSSVPGWPWRTDRPVGRLREKRGIHTDQPVWRRSCSQRGQLLLTAEAPLHTPCQRSPCALSPGFMRNCCSLSRAVGTPCPLVCGGLNTD